MSKISTDTVIRANERIIKNGRIIDSSSSKRTSDITISTRCGGKTYNKRITMDEIRRAYGRALKSISM